jgi:putative protease
MKRKSELLAPAGSFETFLAVINAGADAVYGAGPAFGARAYADNFTMDELREALTICHLSGKKFYLTVNTLLKDDEINGQLYDYLLPLYEYGLDAVIVQDFGAASFIRTHFPKMHLHASTQMSVSSLEGAKLLEECGFERVVLSRELSLEEIAAIHAHTPIEIEAFVHGALCYSYSGQCLYSSLLGGRSGNRGRCAQPCRLEYSLDGRKKSCLLSPKDLCTIDILPKIVDAGVCSLKIEGRMKQAEYAAGVVSVYRKYLDRILEKGGDNYRVSKEDYEALIGYGSRSGFTKGYYEQRNGADMITFGKGAHTKAESLKGSADTSIHRLPIHAEISVQPYEPVCLTYSYEKSDRKKKGIAYGGIPGEAKNQPLTKEALKKRIGKLGNTPFVLDGFDCQLGENLYVSVQELNDLRRKAYESLLTACMQPYCRTDAVSKEKTAEQRPPEQNFKEQIHAKNNKKPLLCCEVSTSAQLQAVLESELCARIYLSHRLLSLTKDGCMVKTKSGQMLLSKLKEKTQAQFYLALPYIIRNERASYYKELIRQAVNDGLSGCLVRTLDSLALCCHLGHIDGSFVTLAADAGLYSFNAYSQEWLLAQGVDTDTYPYELNAKELANASHIMPQELCIYGRIPLMQSAQCVVLNTKGCTKKNELNQMTDRYQKQFPVWCDCAECTNTIYNSVPLALFKWRKEIERISPDFVRMNFVDEDEKQTKNVLALYEAAFLSGKEGNLSDELPFAFTYGHFKRGVE